MGMITETAIFHVRGITDEVSTCDCCGRTDLKRTVVLESEATGIVHFGTDCASRAMATKMSRKAFETVATAASFAAKHGATAAVRKFGFGRPEHFAFQGN